jgi:hypothetical protein
LKEISDDLPEAVSRGIFERRARTEMKTEQPKRWLKRVVLGLVGLAALTASVLAILATTTKLPGEEKTPAGIRRDTASYIPMRDGVQIAADVYLPQDYQAGQRLPALLRTTRCGRDGQFGIPAGCGFQAD